MSAAVLPGDLTSEKAGPILRRGAPVLPSRLGAWVGTGARSLRSNRYARALVESVCPRAGASAAVLLSSRWGNTDADLMVLDLTDPAGMDLAARWLGRHHNFASCVTAPSWMFIPGKSSTETRTADGAYIDHNESEPAMWLLLGDSGHMVTFCRWDPNDGPAPTKGGEGVDVWLTEWSEDPAQALRLACLAAGGRS